MAVPNVEDLAVAAERRKPRGALGNFLHLMKRLRRSDRKECRTVFFMVGGIIVVILLNTYGQIRLNQWQGQFYDALQKHDFPAFLHQLGVFAIIVVALLALVIAQNWTTETVKVKARNWLTRYLLSIWLEPRRAYLLGFAGEIAHNPDQRISQDANRQSDLAISFIIGLAQATLLLLSFLGVLWSLSSLVVFNYGGKSFTIPGYMVWCALIFSLAGSLLTYAFGRSLVPLNAQRYAAEGEFRSQVVRISDNAEVISLERGEAGEKRAAETALSALIAAMQKLANAHARLTWVTSGYGWIGLVFPIIVAAPGYFSGTMTLGDLMMVVGGFNQIQNSLRWFIDNYPSIAEWQAVTDRVVTLIDAIETTSSANADVSRIDFAPGEKDQICVDNLAVCLPGDVKTCILLEERHLVIKKGDRIAFVGARGSGKTTLFIALAGLWPWGHGTIRIPEPFKAMFLAERPYMPAGALLGALAYPEPESSISIDNAKAAMKDVGLEELAGQLTVRNNWDHDLSLSEQQRLGIARLLLRAPDWAFMDNSLSALDDEATIQMLRLVKQRLPSLGIMAMADNRSPDGFFTRVIELSGATSLQLFSLVNGVAKPETAPA